MKVYVVGGWVRDSILGRDPNDKDYVVVGSTPKEMVKLGFKPVGKDFPVFLDEEGNEYALARTERKTGNKHTDFEFTFTPDTTLEEDVLRRDFRCNALAYDEENDKYIDYVNGFQDIFNQELRHINEHFKEDPLRILRASRFSCQLGFTIAPETVKLCQEMVNDGMLEYLTPERIWKEIEKGLGNEFGNPSRFILALREVGALKVILPEIERLFETPEKLEYHASGNSGWHTMYALDKYEYGNSKIRFAVLLHDVAKGTTPAEILPAHHDHDIRGLPIIDEICDRLKVPNDYRNFAKLFCKVHMRIAKIPDMSLKKQYDLVAEISDNFKNFELMDNIFTCFMCDFFGEEKLSQYSTREYYQQVVDICYQIFNIMKNVNVGSLPQEYQESLAKFSGEKFGKMLREYKIRYLREKIQK